MTEQVQEFIKKELKKLKDYHVDDLIRTRGCTELEEILEDIDLDFSMTYEFVESRKIVYEEKEEIPECYVYELLCYIWKSGIEDSSYFKDDYDFVQILRDFGEEDIANRITLQDIIYYKLAELFK